MQRIPERLYQSLCEQARRLFEDGYSAEVKAEVEGEAVSYTLTSPDGEQYEISTLFSTCNCPSYAKWEICKHLQGIERLLKEQALHLQGRTLTEAESESTRCDPHDRIDLQFA